MPENKAVWRSLSSRLRWLRAERGATLAEVATGTGLGSSYLSRLESGSREKPSVKAAAALAIYFKANRGWLVDGEGLPFPDDQLGKAKNELYARLQEGDVAESGESREEQVTHNVAVRIAQLRFSPEDRRNRYLKEIWEELVAYSAECGRNYPKIKEALLEVGREATATWTPARRNRVKRKR